jgi:hypothetical protein
MQSNMVDQSVRDGALDRQVIKAMTMDEQENLQLARQGRKVALMIAGAMLFWIAMQWFGPQIGLTMRVFVLIDLAVLAAFLWALVVAFQLWRKRQAEDE